MKYLLSFLLPLFAVFAVADDGISRVRVGVEGFYKNGCWTPVCVDAAPETPVVVHTVDSDGTPTTFHGFGKTVYAKLGRANAPLTVEIGESRKTLKPGGNPTRQDRSAAFRFAEPVSVDRPIYLVVGSEDIGLQGAVAELTLREEKRPILVKVDSFADLPDRWYGYEAVDMVVLTTADPQQFNGVTSTSPQIKALDEWVQLGGQLFFCAGKDSEKFLAPENGALRPFLPGKFVQMTELRKGTPLELYVNSKRPISMNGTVEAPFLRMPYFTEPRGIPFVEDGNLPLVLRCAHGLGTIVYFGGDLSGKPLADWRERSQLVFNIMLWNEERKTGVQTSMSLIQLGYSDISGQIRSALDRFDGVRIIPFSIVLLLLAAYLLVVGLGDWFLVHRVLKRPMLTWITFPLWIVLFSAAAFWLAAPGRPNQTMLNELDVLDIDVDSGTARRSCWANLYSSGDAFYSLRMSADLPLATKTNLADFPSKKTNVMLPTDRESLFAWNGLPGSGLGGMAPKTVSPTVWRSGSEHSADERNLLKNVPVQVRATKSFFGQAWNLGVPSTRPTISLVDEDGIPIGTLTNPVDAVLEDCLLVYGRWILKLGTLESGQQIEVGTMSERMELRDVLVPKGAIGPKIQRLASYNAQSGDLEYIVRAMSLFHATGGSDAVGLNNAYQRSLDMSHLLTVDRAIFIGSLSQQESGKENFLSFNVVVDGQRPEGRNELIVRQPIPIKLTERSPRLRRSTGQDVGRDKLEGVDRTIHEKGAPAMGP